MYTIRGVQYSREVKNHFELSEITESFRNSISSIGFESSFSTHTDSKNLRTQYYHHSSKKEVDLVASFCINPDTIDTEDLPFGAMRGYRFGGFIFITGADNGLIDQIDEQLKKLDDLYFCFDPQHEKIIFHKKRVAV